MKDLKRHQGCHYIQGQGANKQTAPPSHTLQLCLDEIEKNWDKEAKSDRHSRENKRGRLRWKMQEEEKNQEGVAYPVLIPLPSKHSTPAENQESREAGEPEIRSLSAYTLTETTEHEQAAIPYDGRIKRRQDLPETNNNNIV